MLLSISYKAQMVVFNCDTYRRHLWHNDKGSKMKRVIRKPFAYVNSLAPGGFENIFQNIFFKLISWIDTLSNSCETALRSMPQNPSDDKSTLVQVMAWCRQAASHYLSQCCPRSLSPYGVTRPQWVKIAASWICISFFGQRCFSLLIGKQAWEINKNTTLLIISCQKNIKLWQMVRETCFSLFVHTMG